MAATKSDRGKAIGRAALQFDFDDLRPGQDEAIRSLLARRDTLVVMPTGSGKSAIYQVAGVIRRGAVLVISPLIALQKDQVESIAANNGRAAFLSIRLWPPWK
jgi:ATP-dependent DNA helicase RecQ